MEDQIRVEKGLLAGNLNSNEKESLFGHIAEQDELLAKMSTEIMALRKDLDDLVLLLYGTKDDSEVTTNENTEDIVDE